MNPVEQLNKSLIGRYTIDREIGAGGMATVYLARDERHKRAVALKVLKPELGAILGVERFLAEIQVTANLQHPNLLPLFDSGEANGLLFYVMPYVEGESLRARLEREKQLPIDEAVRIAVAVASALEYAHGHGVIHRDLKPENILLQSGQPVIADFGIALAVSNAGGARITQTGLSLGTPQYMSPEQATGDRAIDGRSDIYSLGAVTYEMLTGDAPHTGSTVQAIVAKVLTERPPSVRVARSAVPEHVAFAVDHALEKLPADRWSTAREFGEALQGRGPALTSALAARGSAGTSRGSRGRLHDPVVVALGAIALLAAGIVAATAAGALSFRGRAGAPPTARFAITTPPGTRAVLGTPWPAAITRDGSATAYFAELRSGAYQAFVRRSDELESRPIAGTDHATQLIFSPDGKWIAFEADGKLMKVQPEGGAAIAITDAASDNGADWSVRNEIVLGADAGFHGLSVVSADGGTPAEFTHPDSAHGETEHLWPVVLADGKTVLFTLWAGNLQRARLAVGTIGEPRIDRLSITGIRPLGVFARRLIYIRADGVVMAVPFDVGARKVMGSAVPVLDSVIVCSSCNGNSAIQLSLGGAAAYMRGGVTSHMVWADAHGALRAVSPEGRAFAKVRLSPDGRLIAAEILGAGQSDIWIYDLATSTFSRLTSGGNNKSPDWTADGRNILFTSDRSGRPAVWTQLADGSAPAEKLADAPDVSGQVISPDGHTLLVTEFRDNRFDLFTVPLRGSDSAKAYPGGNSTFQAQARFSPDGRWVALVTDEPGEVFVRSFPDAGANVQVSMGGGGEPVWSRDGRRLFYRSGRKLMVATVATSPSFRVMSRDSVLTGTFVDGTPDGGAWDVSKDGARFLMLQPDGGELSLVAVMNWLTELEAKTNR
jgi:eukaryotic-like serine/threonine-protein kinase